jgi:hypothetical protein
MLGAAVRGDNAVSSWQVVSSGSVKSLSDLRGKNVALPSTGAKESAFLTNVLLDGEVDAAFFGKVSSAPDALSAVTMVSAGRADAAFVPGGIDLPGGVSRALTVSTVGWPMFVALPSADKSMVDRFGKAARSYSGSGTFTRFTSPESGQYRKLDFGRPARRGPMAVPPPARLSVRDILVGRVFKIELSDVLQLAEAPNL